MVMCRRVDWRDAALLLRFEPSCLVTVVDISATRG